MSRSVRRYTKEFKQEAVNLAIKLPSISKAAEELGVPAPTLHTWVHQLQNKPPVTGSRKDAAFNPAVLIEENRQLHKELAIAKEEREILKKAAAYFAKHQK
jgi:transposase